MGLDWLSKMPEGLEEGLPVRIETFPSPQRQFAALDLQTLWHCRQPAGGSGPALGHPWGPRHRQDWSARGLIVWPRGEQWWRLRLPLACPPAWRTQPGPAAARARLVLRWWADRAELWVDGEHVHSGDLFDTACRWELPLRWWRGEPLELELRLRSPRHDDGALIHSRIELEPRQPTDPHGLLASTMAELTQLRREHGHPDAPGEGVVQVLSHAHLDLAWLWPVADTWRAAERTFLSALDLIERFPALHFGHSTPALYAWLEWHRPALFRRIRAAMRAGRWEPLNGPWVETDCVLVGTASLLRQFQEGQRYSRCAFPEWEHPVAWLPDSFGFAAGLPAVAAATGVRWFCTHKLAWNATNPFPHRLFRWRGRCGSEVLALMTAPIGSDGDPLAIERQRLEWQRATGCADALWLPGVGDHGGGPTAEMLEQLALWERQPQAAPQRHGTLRAYLERLAPLAPRLPVWRDELYLELHRGCATSRPDQKRHNRTLERLLQEAELVLALLQPGGEAVDWLPLLFQQFHDILPGTSIAEVFEQAEPQWRAARRQARRRRDGALLAGLGSAAAGAAAAGVTAAGVAAAGVTAASSDRAWWVAQLQPLPPLPRTLRLPAGAWRILTASGEERPLVSQRAPGGGQWLQLPGIAGVDVLTLRRASGEGGVSAPIAAAAIPAAPIDHPVELLPAPDLGPGRWRLGNGLLTVAVGPRGVEQVWDGAGIPQLAAPLEWCRWADRGEFWDAWDIAADYRRHPLAWEWTGEPQWLERGPLCSSFLWRGRCGTSSLRLDGRLLAGCPWLELSLAVDWRQRHELLRLEIPLAAPACRWAADTPAAVIERPAHPLTPRERARWEVPTLSWLAAVGAGSEGGGLALLLDGPQGVSVCPERLGVSLLRAPTWPDPGADNGWQRLRLALLPCPRGWRAAAVPQQARRLRAPLWCRPAPAWQGPAGPAAPRPPLFPDLGEDLHLVGLRPAGDGTTDVVLAVQNEGPCRRRIVPGPRWQSLGRLDGLDLGSARLASGVVPSAGLATGGTATGGLPTATKLSAGTPSEGRERLSALDDPLLLGPWQLGFWRLGLVEGNDPLQSS